MTEEQDRTFKVRFQCYNGMCTYRIQLPADLGDIVIRDKLTEYVQTGMEELHFDRGNRKKQFWPSWATIEEIE